MRRFGAMAIMVAALLTLVPANALAESTLWTLTASPLAVTTGTTTTFTLRATNADPLAGLLSSSEIGCVVLDVPGNFAVASAAVTGSSAGGSWFATLAGNRVRVRAGSGGDRLALLQWVGFTVRATAMSGGSLTWAARAYRQQDCSGTGALLGVPPIVVASGPVLTPTPTATPAPTAKPTTTPTPTPTARPTATPRPTPTPTPILPLPSVSIPVPLPSLVNLPTPVPSVATTPTPGQSHSTAPRRSPTPSAVGSSAASPTASNGVTQPGVPSSSPGAPAAFPGFASAGLSGGSLRIPFDGDMRLDTGFGVVDVLAGAEIWAVPAATIALPGLLLLVWVGLQAIGALAWIPAVRRLRGDDEQSP